MEDENISHVLVILILLYRTLSFKAAIPKTKKAPAYSYTFTLSKLPEEIDADKSYYKVKDKSVHVYLRKVSATSWEGYTDELEPQQ